MNSQHTPGPWRAEPGSEHNFPAVVTGRDCITVDTDNDADAYLIAAAPELLAALELLTDRLALVPGYEDAVLQAARAAIAKATGGAA